jgi:hypothetical protein
MRCAERTSFWAVILVLIVDPFSLIVPLALLPPFAPVPRVI